VLDEVVVAGRGIGAEGFSRWEERIERSQRLMRQNPRKEFKRTNQPGEMIESNNTRILNSGELITYRWSLVKRQATRW
jgi:hypothetical protein